MDIESIKTYLDKLVNKGLEIGFEEAKGSFEYTCGMCVDIFEGEVSNFENNTSQNLSFVGKKDKQMGSSATSIFEDSSVDYLVSSSWDNIKVKDDEDEDFLYCDKDNSDLKYCGLSDSSYKNSYDSFKELGLKIEKAVLESDEAIKSVDYLEIAYSRDAKITKNSLGLTSVRETDSVSIGIEAKCEKNGAVKTGSYFWYGMDIDDFNLESFVKELLNRTVKKLGASSVESGKYNVIFSQEAFISLFSSYSDSLTAYSIQKELSLFRDLVNMKVATEMLTIREIPCYEKAQLKFPFDNDGVLTYDKDLIKDGVFVTPLHSLKTAYKDGIKPTGNYFNGVEYSNIIMEPGKKSFEELLSSVGSGLYITDLNGLHAGINPISGDFSLFCEGFLIEDGLVVRPVEQITISGNFLDVLKNITEIGNDVIHFPDGAGEFFCPSVVVKDMNIAGEA